jgi:zinc transporter, ZIP family
MLGAFLWGLLATSSLIMGGVIASRIALSKRIIGIVMAFGAGTLISAVSYELIFEAVRIGKLTGFPALGLFAGAFTFFFSDRLIGRLTGADPVDLDSSSQSRLVIPMVLAIILDGVPESIVIGLGIYEGGAISLAMLVAVFVSNLPEAIAGTVGLKAGGASDRKIIVLWILIAPLSARLLVSEATLCSAAYPLLGWHLSKLSPAVRSS